MPSLPVYKTGMPVEVKKPRVKRSTIIYSVLILCMLWVAYIVFFTSISDPSNGDLKMPNPGPEIESHEDGLNLKPGHSDLIQVQDLSSKFLPETGKHRNSGKLVVVGDVHGMKDALKELLEKIKFNENHDHLILAGDMISKGPDSAGVVDLAMKLGASGVRGNHEDRVILAHTAMVAEEESAPSEEAGEKQDGLEEYRNNDVSPKDRALVKELGEKRIKWLKKLPVILRVGDLGNMGQVVVVHAGLVPGVKLEKQDPSMVMNMRTITEGVPSDEHEGKGWWKVWNKYQKKLPKKERTTVIYGHDSKRGLKTEKYSMGIDTGCLKGGQLTAVVIEGTNSDHRHKIVHVNCKDVRDK